MENDPYLFINCTQFDEKEARKAAEVLHDLGIRAYFDESAFDGVFWSGKRADLIRNCTAVLELNCPGLEYNSHVLGLAACYADLLEIPKITIDADERFYGVYTDLGFGFRGSVWDDNIAEKLKGALEKAGWPDSKLSVRSEQDDKNMLSKENEQDDKNMLSKESEQDDKKMVSVGSVQCDTDEKYEKNVKNIKDRSYEKDLYLRYYEEYGIAGKPFSFERKRFCNLRTHEVFDIHYRTVTEDDEPLVLSESKLFEMLVWLKDDVLLLFKSDADDYEGTFEDQLFRNELYRRKCEPPKYLLHKYEILKKGVSDPFPDGYPYMDEFEYIDSL